jgi:histone arginine demethylase JMJD6
MINYQNIPDKIDRISKPTKSEFNENYGLKSKPVLITGLMDNWKAKTKWTSDFLKQNFGNLEEPAYRSNNRDDKKIFKLEDYINYMETNSDKDPYYLTNTQFHLDTEMVNDYEVPSYFTTCLQVMKDKLPRKFQLSCIYIGAKNTFSKLHLDIFNSSAWNAVISGKKIWLFYPPNQFRYLYNGAVNPFEPDLNKYPEFVNATPIVCVQNPGEVVYTPSRWWHAVYNEEAGLSLTENFVNETNFETVIMTMLYHKNIDEARVVKACMNRFRMINQE